MLSATQQLIGISPEKSTKPLLEPVLIPELNIKIELQWKGCWSISSCDRVSGTEQSWCVGGYPVRR